MSIKVFKTLSGDEVIANVYDADKASGTFRVEYPFVADTYIDENTRYPDTVLIPWLFTANPEGPFHVTAQSLAIMPMDPKPMYMQKYQAIVDEISQRLEAAEQLKRASHPKLKPAGNTLGR